ncbi:AbrB/MazE/SpoVT family DNA-binding domain-containing protein [Glaciimonas soli]|uniref:AbrB/MazE/SpoVT family DNA-binding domain-containing protein n=1 Tax=Glaciimonas soli TaxID=2590999 RepID=A0A843YPX7_9BURK|nr:AbrB/MazE/SpoVT family DNA-binding domain-containing protein [Glaciimonas soli]MQR01090.1 AbrB/MazE/SpoVT family DNA-binding domain-containing protein [Glaciimonas soli]
MKTVLRKMGNSRGVLIPKPFLIQTGLDIDEVDIQVENDRIVISRPEKTVRAGWAQASQKIADSGDDVLVWPDFANEDDQELVW